MSYCGLKSYAQREVNFVTTFAAIIVSMLPLYQKCQHSIFQVVYVIQQKVVGTLSYLQTASDKSRSSGL